MSVTYQYYFLSSSSITFSQLYSLWCSVRLRRIWILPLVALRHLCDDTLTALNPRTQSSRWHSSSLLCLPDYSSCHFTFSLRCDCKFVGFQWLSSNLADYSLVEMAWACHCHNLKKWPCSHGDVLHNRMRSGEAFSRDIFRSHDTMPIDTQGSN